MTTIRVHNIHLAASDDEIRSFFSSNSTRVVASSLEHSHDDPSKKIATVSFASEAMSRIASALDQTTLNVPSGQSRIEIDDHFRGFTVISSGKNPNIEYVWLR